MDPTICSALNALTGVTVRNSTVQGQSLKSNVCLTLRLRAHLTGYAQGEKGVFETLTQGKGEVY